jgi:hypothetical protein
VAVLGFGSGHPTFGALMAVLFVVALLRVGRTIIIGGAVSPPLTHREARHGNGRAIPQLVESRRLSHL